MITVLSQRNLLSLLHKLEMPDSKRTIIKGNGETFMVQNDAEYYEGRDPGPMHPDTEAFVAEIQVFLADWRLRQGA